MNRTRFVIDASSDFLFAPRRKSLQEKEKKEKEKEGIRPRETISLRDVALNAYNTTPNPHCAWLTYESFFNHEVVCNLKMSIFCMI
jgi:hypothetical protein